MKLTFKNYTAISDGDRFDLYKTKTVTATEKSKEHKAGDKYETTILIGYGYTFESLLKRITADTLSEKDTMTIVEYIKEFKVIVNEISNTLK